jgi:DNA-binding transcriptional LysR family regulator
VGLTRGRAWASAAPATITAAPAGWFQDTRSPSSAIPASTDTTGIRYATVAAGLGIAVMPRLGREPVPQGARMIAVTPALCRRIYATWRHASARRPAIAATVAALRTVCAGSRALAAGQNGLGDQTGKAE